MLNNTQKNLAAAFAGESQARNYPNWIAATAFGQDYNRRICGAVTLTKSLDRASAPLAMASTTSLTLTP